MPFRYRVFFHPPLWRLGLFLAVLAGAPHAQAQAKHPADQWEFGVETGYLTKVKHNSPLDYRIVPTTLVWRSPAMFEIWRGESGARLTVRNRLGVVMETFARGPEDYYFAFAGSPSIELWSADQKTAAFYEIGGGVGLVNAKNVPGGQGQDLSFNWFTQLGVRRQMAPKVAVTAGAFFTHHSNLGMTHPNPGIDVLGIKLGLIWTME